MKHTNTQNALFKRVIARTALMASAGSAVLLVSGCSYLGNLTKTEGLNPQAARISDERILADRVTIDAMQKRLTALNNSAVPVKSYNFAKAQCWLDTAKTQYHENDRTGYIEESLGQAKRIIVALEADKNAAPVTDTPLVAGSHKLREDLWNKLAGYRNHEQFSCAAQTTACAEVRLVRAGHADEQTGWRQANPHIGMVEDAVRQADAQLDACKPAPAPAPPPAPSPAPAVAEKIDISADGLFELNKSAWTNILPEGRARLTALAEQLKGYKSIDSIAITGHTDRLGRPEHNQVLSQARAQTIKQYFESQGVKGKISATGVGSTQPVTGDKCKGLARTPAIPCLQADRRIELQVVGTK